ncbi:MAG: D-hexose-6-phosphate mutarotase [Verrucomicrobiota bacterium]
MTKPNTAAAGPAGRVVFLAGRGNLPMMEITTAWSTAEIYLHGAHVTHFQRKGDAPLLFLSQCSRFENGKAIRGGIPVILPWFGAREGLGQHGFVRNAAWELQEIASESDDSVSVRLAFSPGPAAAMHPPFEASYVVTVNDQLELELIVTNTSATDTLVFENCLHTYFFVEDITAVSVHGLKGAAYLDKTANQARRTETDDAIRISSEVDRTYLDAPGAVEIEDARIGRVIRVEKENSASTVVWNPWVAKAQQMADFGNEEYRNMICVESGNVSANRIELPPKQTSRMKVRLGSAPLS